MVLLLRGGVSLTSEVGLMISMVLRGTAWCFYLLGTGLDAQRAAACRECGSSANWSLS